MPGFLIDGGATILCPHGGKVSITVANPRVKVCGRPVAVITDTTLVSGCVFTIPPGKPQPCMQVRWLVPAARVRVGGRPVLLNASTGLCLTGEQIPQGPPMVVQTQPRVRGQ